MEVTTYPVSSRNPRPVSRRWIDFAHFSHLRSQPNFEPSGYTGKASMFRRWASRAVTTRTSASADTDTRTRNPTRSRSLRSANRSVDSSAVPPSGSVKTVRRDSVPVFRSSVRS